MLSSQKSQRFQVTERDLKILDYIYLLEKPDSSHLCKLLFRPSGKNKQGEPVEHPKKYQTTSAQATRRLEHLEAAKLIQHERPPLISGTANLPYAFSLTARGYEE